ncbi:hypothetical protein [Acetivibrio mesophilus]|uniref:Uncharacterized protein n=1 Tax=Acetivibrio mesophilus TaxID=2487273 RepID=A0A4V1K1Z4_9FIRM|nr:hypothetical protein [Acetivibrio mesophilus]ODM27055.1 hypothetical protein A7W90_13015 [Clostridium sp. Bc-iso-3]RXE58499.1 hypothetical protein EFD62_11995 [Acetivibrio mesophilus]HHV28779.1 hypothetical protein [Clostridium sp.]
MREAFYPLDKDENIISKPTLYFFYENLIYFFSRDSAIEIVSKYEKATDEYYGGIYKDIIYLSEKELLTRIKDTDSELVLPYIFVFLWNQRLGMISKEAKLEMDSHLINSLVSDFGEYIVVKIYIIMTLSGYADVYLKKPLNYEYFNGKYESYLSIIEDLIGFYTKPGYNDDDYFSLLCDCLCIMGVKNIKKHGLYNEVIALVEYVLLNYELDERLQWLSYEKFLLLIYSLNYNTDAVINYLEKILEKEQPASILTLVLSVKLFGERVLKLFKNRNTDCSYFGGIDNFYRLVNN